jgi:hypothetical protein
MQFADKSAPVGADLSAKQAPPLRNTNDLDAALHQLETVITQVVDAVANGQAERALGRREAVVIGVLSGFLELVHGVDATFGISCMKLSNEYCSHLIYNLWNNPVVNFKPV